MKGTIFNIQHYALHDGPGIRTTVFLKGCPLRCRWCHNPESLSSQKQLVYWPERCLSCGRCIAPCPEVHENPVRMPDENRAAPAAEHCRLCGFCAEACPSEALELSGNEISVEEVIQQLDKDALFYEESGGGVTFSGGEPLVQPAFLLALLTACKLKEWHTTLDTCGHAPLKVLQSVAPYVDLFLYDLKHMDDERHLELTGVSNRLILSNLEWLAGSGRNVCVRIPVIPGINDDIPHFHQLGKYLRNLTLTHKLTHGLTKVHLLPYHDIGADKYARQGMTYRLQDVTSPTPQQMDEIATLLSGYGLDIVKGG